VATLIIPNRKAAENPKVGEIIHHAEAVFIAGGDQSLYVRFWKGTPVETAINADVAYGKPIGGTSAGLAVLGEFVYGAMRDKENDRDLTSADVLSDPYYYRVTVVHDFLLIPYMKNTLTDTHFAKRDRMGRSLVFLARIVQDGWSMSPREIAVDQGSAILVEGNGKATVIGVGRGAWFMRVTRKPEICKPGSPLTFTNISVFHGPTGAKFDLATWTGNGGNHYQLSVENGRVHSTRPQGSIY
jgi:cyanophycinase-like exopeptidase